MDDPRIYNRALTPADIQALAVPEPSTLSILALASMIGALLMGKRSVVSGRH